MVDALLRKYNLLSILEAKVLGFHFIKSLHKKDKDFKNVAEDLSTFGSFTLQVGFLVKGNKLCIPKSPLRDLIINKAHGGALFGHFGINKTL